MNRGIIYSERSLPCTGSLNEFTLASKFEDFCFKILKSPLKLGLIRKVSMIFLAKCTKVLPTQILPVAKSEKDETGRIHHLQLSMVFWKKLLCNFCSLEIPVIRRLKPFKQY